MTPQPVVFAPILKAKPWGGRRLAELGKVLPPDESIGESWELSDLPGDESRVARGPLAGRSIRELVTAWGHDLLGGAPAADGRFPLLIKFLDACENLSVQVHPKPDDDDPQGWSPGIKHECWYVLRAEPHAELYIGLRKDVTRADVESASNSPRIVELLQRRPAQVGACYYLPSGTLHALGRGVLVAEVQTPSDVTYRLFDWGRVDAHGRPRAMHVAECLANIRYDVAESEIAQPAAGDAAAKMRPLVRCSRFTLDLVRLSDAEPFTPAAGCATALIVLRGAVRLRWGAEQVASEIAAGETVLLPARCPGLLIERSGASSEFLCAGIP